MVGYNGVHEQAALWNPILNLLENSDSVLLATLLNLTTGNSEKLLVAFIRLPSKSSDF